MNFKTTLGNILNLQGTIGEQVKKKRHTKPFPQVTLLLIGYIQFTNDLGPIYMETAGTLDFQLGFKRGRQRVGQPVLHIFTAIITELQVFDLYT